MRTAAAVRGFAKKSGYPVRWVTSGADSQSVQYVPFDIWTSCKACTHWKIKDHPPNPPLDLFVSATTEVLANTAVKFRTP